MSACAPLYEALMRHRQTEQVSLHMPGHKGRAGCLAPLGKLPIFDVTELPSTGSLFDAEGPTLLAEQAAAKAFGTAGTFFPQADARFVSRLCYALPLHWGERSSWAALFTAARFMRWHCWALRPYGFGPGKTPGLALPGESRRTMWQKRCKNTRTQRLFTSLRRIITA